jgi:tricorn protease
VDGCRRQVRELSDGRLGYLHVPDMMGAGWGLTRWHQAESYPMDARRGPLVALANQNSAPDGDIITAATSPPDPQTGPRKTRPPLPPRSVRNPPA